MRRHRRILLVFALVGLSTATLAAADLTDAALRAWADHLGRARQSFLDRQSQPPGGSDADRMVLRSGQTIVRPGSGDGILTMPASLIHHWRGAIFIRGVTLDEAVTVSRAYRDYPAIFHPIVAAKVLSEEGNALRVQFRMRESAAGRTAVLDLWSNIRYMTLDATRAYELSTSDEILEVKDAGRSGERHLPAGRDSGYLWRAATFTRFVEADGGVYMEMETIGLSRGFPPLLGWLIEPIARRIGRGSVADSVEEFQRAVLMRHPTRR